MKRLYTLFSIVLLFAAASAQTVTLTFTGRDANNQTVTFDSVVINNLTKGWQETLTTPGDTVLVLWIETGIDEFVANGGFVLSQNNPNPFDGTTNVNLTVAEQGDVAVEITDITGRVVGMNHYSPQQPGTHEIRVTLSAAGIYFLTARQNGRAASVKMVNRGDGGGNAITFADMVRTKDDSPLQTKSHTRSLSDNPFDLGDQMEYVGFATINGVEVESQHVTQAQNGSETIVLAFDVTQINMDGLPCPGTPTVTDIDDNVYSTVMIGTQCWMKENLKTTRWADNTPIPLGDTTSYTAPFRYMPNNDLELVSEYGYLYNWNAVMHDALPSAANPSGVQGVCPDGWHVPSDAEWVQLTDYVKSRSEYACINSSGIEKFAKSLAANYGWLPCSSDCAVGNDLGDNNITGFSAIPAGTHQLSGTAAYGFTAFFWTTTAYENFTAWSHYLYYCNGDDREDLDSGKDRGMSVRCVRD